MNHFFKEFSRKAIKQTLGFFGYQVTRKKENASAGEPLSFFEGVLAGALARHPGLQLIQVGANDGVTNDPIFRFVRDNDALGRVILVEPQPEVIGRLEENYSNKDVIIINCAIDSDKSEMLLYRIKPEYWPSYKGITGSGVSSFDKEYIVKKARLLPRHLYSDPEDVIESIRVPCCKLDDLLIHLSKQVATAIQVDTEGHDDSVIYSLDTKNIMPVAINYEFNHLSEERLTKLRNYLADKGYKIFRWSKSDEVAIMS